MDPVKAADDYPFETVHHKASHDLPLNCSVRNHPASPVPATGTSPSDIPTARIMVIGIGLFGARMAQLLSLNLPGVTCHEVMIEPNRERSGDIKPLLSSVQQSDLVFILADLDDQQHENLAQILGNAACNAGVLTIAVRPLANASLEVLTQQVEERKWFDTMFSVSDCSLPKQLEPIFIQDDVLIGYSMRHVVTAITSLIIYQSAICIDFADIKNIMCRGSAAWAGVGIASGDDRGVMAVTHAIDRLKAQQVSLSSASGVLACVHGSSALTMADLDDVSRTIHRHIGTETNILIGLICDEKAGYNVKVTIMNIQPRTLMALEVH